MQDPNFVCPVPYPAIFWGCWFFDECREEKNCCAAGYCGGHCKPSPVGSRDKAPEKFGYFAFWISSKHHSHRLVARNGDEGLHQKSTLLRVWGSEFGIAKWYTGFKVPLDTALLSITIFQQEMREGENNYHKAVFGVSCVYILLLELFTKYHFGCFKSN